MSDAAVDLALEIDKLCVAIMDAFAERIPADVMLGAMTQMCTGMLATMTEAVEDGTRPDMRDLALVWAARLDEVAREVRKRIGGD